MSLPVYSSQYNRHDFTLPRVGVKIADIPTVKGRSHGVDYWSSGGGAISTRRPRPRAPSEANYARRRRINARPSPAPSMPRLAGSGTTWKLSKLAVVVCWVMLEPSDVCAS